MGAFLFLCLVLVGWCSGSVVVKCSTSVGQTMRRKISHLLGSSLAASFVRLRLIVGFRFPAFVSPFRSGNDRDSVCCLAVKGCGGGSSPVGQLYGRSLCHPVRLQRGTHFRACGVIFGTRRIFVLPLPEKNNTPRPACSGKSLSLRPTP